jgi:hypothetical protein
MYSYEDRIQAVRLYLKLGKRLRTTRPAKRRTRRFRPPSRKRRVKRRAAVASGILFPYLLCTMAGYLTPIHNA